MQKATSSQQPHLHGTIQHLTSSPLAMNTDSASHFRYWSGQGVLQFLEQLLEDEGMGIAAYAAIGRTAARHVADLAFESELAQGAICILLRKEIAARGEIDVLRRKTTPAISNDDCGLQGTIGFASRNQAGLADMIAEAVLNISDPELNSKLIYLLLLHRKQVEQLQTFVS